MQLPHFPPRRLIGAAVLTCAAALMPANATAATAGSPAQGARHSQPVIAYVAIEPVCPGGRVTPIDTATNEALKPIKVPPGVTAIAISPNTRTVYVSSGKSVGPGTECQAPPLPANTVTPISTATRKAGKPIYVGRYPGAIAITPNGRTAYVLTARGVVPIRTATGKAGQAIKGTAGASGIAITPNGRTAYTVNSASGTVTPIRTATNTALTPIKVGKIAYGIALAITPDSATAYVLTARGVVPVRTAADAERRAIKGTRGASALAITPNGRTAYAVNSVSGTVTPIRTATSTALTPIKVGRSGYNLIIAITPNGRTAYVTGAVTFAGGYFRATVTAIRTATNSISKVITIKSRGGIEFSAIGITPDGRTADLLNLVELPGASYGTVIPLRLATGTAGKAIIVGAGPSAIVFTS